MSDGEDLVRSTSSSDSDSDGHVLELIGSDEIQWFVNFSSENSWFNQIEGFSVDSDDTGTFSGSGDGNSILLSSESLNNLFVHDAKCFKL